MVTLEARPREEGSAFVISILVLFVLTILGMALMLTTTTEKDIAINYRWGEQAFFNADAALEYGKNELSAHLLNSGDFAQILPPARANVTVPDATQAWGVGHPEPGACNPSATGCRDYQYFADRCPPGGGGPCVRVYIGRVLVRVDGSLAQYDFREPAVTTPGDLDGDGVADVEGSITLWVRRPVAGVTDYGAPTAALPAGRHDRVILTAEGTAPGTGGAGAGRAVSVRRLEMSIRPASAGIEGDQYSDTSRASDGDQRRGVYDQVRSGSLGSN